MSSNSAPPPGSFQQQFGNPSNGSIAFSPAAIAIIGLLGAAFLMVSYHTALAKFCTGSRAAFRRNGVSGEAGDQHEGALAILTRGLEESVIQAIPVYKYAKDEGLVDGSECSVCLGEFQNDESLRLLPKCNHAFHLSCIDQWLHTHSNCPLCRANIETPGLSRRPDSPRVVTGENHGNAVQERQVTHETGDSANLRSRSDQRSSEPVACNPNDHRFTTEGEVEPPNSPILEDMSNARCTDLVGLKSFSTRRELHDRQDGKEQLLSARDDGSAPLMIQRSSSMSSIYNMADVGLEQFSSTKTIVYDVLPGNEGRQLLWPQSHDESDASSKTDAGVRLLVDMGTTCSSSCHSSPTDLVSSRSFNCVTDIKRKEESMSPPQLAKSLLSFKVRSFAVKRSFSGERLFGFRSKSSAGVVNSRLPI